MIELMGVSKNFGGRMILNDFTLKVHKNEFVTIVGPSGAGKTTVLNLMGLLDKPDDGTVMIDSCKNPGKKDTVFLRRYKIGYIFQNYVLMNNETVKENLLISKAYNKDFSTEKMVNTLEQVGLDSSYLKMKVYQLSGGEQQRIAIARVMLKPCEIILADEPTGNLDNANKKAILSLFRELQNVGKTIVCVTHDKSISDHSDRVIEIKRMCEEKYK
jgi:putative ABC transport system ATP-binding protein